MKTTRRSFIKAAAIGAGLAATPSMALALDMELPEFSDKPGMLYDSTLCVGCKACVTACRKANFDVDSSSTLADEDMNQRWADVNGLDYRTKNIIKMYTNPDDASDFAFIKRQCMHCKHPGCVSACPVKAMVKNPDTGIVEYHKERCIGCRYCQIACPFNVPAFEWHKALPKIVKCELCRETTLKEKGTTACVDVCPTKAVIFGKQGDLLLIAKERLAANPDKYIDKIYGEFDYGGTGVIYISRVNFEDLGMPILPSTSFAAKSEKLQHTIYKKMIAPVALYGTLLAVALKHKRSRDKKGDEGGKHE